LKKKILFVFSKLPWLMGYLKKGSGYSTGSGLLVLDAIQPVKLFRQAYRRFSTILS